LIRNPLEPMPTFGRISSYYNVQDIVIGIKKTLKNAAGFKQYTIGTIFSTTVALIDWLMSLLVGTEMKELIGIPSWFIGIIVLLCFMVYWFLGYAHKLRIQIDEARKDIAILREDGVKIRNDGKAMFGDESSFNDWATKVTEWNEKVKDSLAKISEADSIWFGTLDVVQQPRIPANSNIKNRRHLKLYSEHDKRLDNLGQMIRDHWRIRDI